VSKRAIACVMTMAVLGLAPAAFAGKGGNPNPDSCGVPMQEAHDFKADPTAPGASEIVAYPPVPYGCTGATK
jgi:hypothetical protein